MGFGAASWTTFFRRMPLFLQYYVVLLPLAMSMVSVVNSGRKLPPVYWNSTNSLFYTSSRNNEIDIKLYDSIDFMCPQYPQSTDVSEREYYTIYMVNKTEYDSCIINDTSKAKLIVNCSSPTRKSRMYYTLLISDFQSIPGNPDFHRGQKYYFITTSGGGLNELDNQYLGACYSKNMRLILNVCCTGDQTPRPTSKTTTAQPPRTTRPPHTTPRPSTTKTTPTTTSTTTTTSATTTTKRDGDPTRKPGSDNNLPDENVIHVKGPKNVGFINDNASQRTSQNVATLIVTLIVVYLLR